MSILDRFVHASKAVQLTCKVCGKAILPKSSAAEREFRRYRREGKRAAYCDEHRSQGADGD